MPDPGAQVNDSVQRMLRGRKEDEERVGGELSGLIYHWLWRVGVKASRAREKIPDIPDEPVLAKLGMDQKILMAAGSLFFASLKERYPNFVFGFTPTWDHVVGPLLDDKRAEAIIYHYKRGIEPYRILGKMKWLSEHYPLKKRSDEIYYFMALGSEVIIDYSLPSHATQNTALLAISALLEHSQTTRLRYLTANNNDRDPSAFSTLPGNSELPVSSR
ncbi:hypothetical protein PsorP6_005668 [Peronosclerospora sorghi]|uniref:Uncharacterized protein n=1 Tax=Peronosclerospora sorghi TaxID=230839 RepID=A0ACC0W631_9STRA|nr:hypothetical protein PsorP6_005668 [Peronosclerospora sorghi]